MSPDEQAPLSISLVLVPLDGSPASEDALPFASAIAEHTGAAIALVHVREPRDTADGLQETYPASLRGDPRLAPGVDVRMDVLEGDVRDELLAHAVAIGAELIVLTSRGHGGVKRALLGSVADAIVRRSAIPVLIARPRAATANATAPLFRVLLPLDGSEAAERIVPHVIALLGTNAVHYILLRVRPALTPDGRLEPGPLLTLPSHPTEDGYLSSMAARVAKHGALVSTRAITHALNAETIVQVAEDEQVDVIAMTTRGAGGTDRLLFGSVSDEVVRRAPCSVLVLGPSAGG